MEIVQSSQRETGSLPVLDWRPLPRSGRLTYRKDDGPQSRQHSARLKRREAPWKENTMLRSGAGSGRDFSADVILGGRISGVSRVAALGVRSIAVAFSSLSLPQDVWPGAAAIFPLPSSAVSLEVLSSSASDSVAGIGAQVVAFDTLDANYAQIAQFSVQLNGTTPVALPNGAAYLRINAARTGLVTPNTSARQKNIGDITIRDAGGGTIRAVIPASIGTLQQCIYTPPAGSTLVIQSLECAILSSAGGVSRGADFLLTFRGQDGSAPSPRRLGCTDIQPYRLDTSTDIRVAEKTDFIGSCIYTSSNNMTVGMSFEGHLYKN